MVSFMVSFLLKNPRLLLAGVSLIALAIFVYMWRSEIIDSAQNAYKAILSNEVIATNEQSKKDAVDVKQEEQSLDAAGLDRSLCALGGLVRGNEGCDRY